MPPPADLAQDPASLRRVLVGLGLAAPDEAITAQPLTGGVSSAIYRVDLRSGPCCIKQALPRLKVAKLWEVPVERVFAEIAWLREAQRIVPGHVPRVLGEDAGSRSFIMEFLGPQYRNWKSELLAHRVDPATAQATGDVLGRVHAATADREDIARRFATDANFHALRLEPYLVEAARVHPDLSGPLMQAVERTAATRRVLVHGDVSPKNILVGPAGPVLLDAECAWYGDPAFDVAFCLNHFLLKAVHLPPQAWALLQCFDAFVAAYLGHVHWEPAAALEERIAWLLPGLALARIDGKSPVEYLDAPTREVVRRRAIDLLREPSRSPAQVAQRWMEGATT